MKVQYPEGPLAANPFFFNSLLSRPVEDTHAVSAALYSKASLQRGARKGSRGASLQPNCQNDGKERPRRGGGQRSSVKVSFASFGFMVPCGLHCCC